jgi:site-specific recombinase
MFAEIVSETEGVNLFGETGIPGDRGFLAELSDRLMARLLPQPSDEHDLARLVTRLYRTADAVERLATLAPALFGRLAAMFVPPEREETWRPLQAAFADGFRLLATRVEAQGLARKLRARSRPSSVTASPSTASPAPATAWPTTGWRDSPSWRSRRNGARLQGRFATKWRASRAAWRPRA